MSARWWGSPVFVAPTAANAGLGWLRPTGVVAVSGAIQGGGLDTAPYPYDPDPDFRRALRRTGVTVGGSGQPAVVGLDFDVAVALAYLSTQSHLAQVLVVSVGAPVYLADGSGFTAAVGHPHDVGGRSRFASLLALRWSYAAGNQLRIVSEGGVIVCALGAARVQS